MREWNRGFEQKVLFLGVLSVCLPILSLFRDWPNEYIHKVKFPCLVEISVL